MFPLLAPILGERSADVVLFFGEVAAFVAARVSLVGRLWLDQLSFGHSGDPPKGSNGR
jgi:hypothetical protein